MSGRLPRPTLAWSCKKDLWCLFSLFLGCQCLICAILSLGRKSLSRSSNTILLPKFNFLLQKMSVNKLQQLILNTQRSQIYGQKLMELSFFFKKQKWEMVRSKTSSTMDGLMIIMSVMCFVLPPDGGLHYSMFLCVFMVLKLQTGEISMTNWSRYLGWLVQYAQLIQPFALVEEIKGSFSQDDTAAQRPTIPSNVTKYQFLGCNFYAAGFWVGNEGI